MQVAIDGAARALDDDGLERVMVERYAGLLQLAYLILHDYTEAEDATQLALERAWRSRRQLRNVDDALWWLRRIVVREALRARSSPWRILRSPLDVIDLQARGRSAAADHERLDLIRAYERLPAEQAAAVVLHHYLAYPVSEAAELLDVPLETVRSRLRRAMRRLREELQDG